MSEPSEQAQPSTKSDRPFPWYCPKCRFREVRLVTIPYRCERVCEDGQSITFNVDNFSVPRCDHCGELVFDYNAEEQINQAFAAHMAR